MIESSVQAEPQGQGATNRESADIVVAIPSYNNASTIEQVVRAAQECLKKYYSSERSIILHCDGGSKDGTLNHALEAGVPAGTLLQVPYPVYSVHKLGTSYEGIPGKINAIQTVFRTAKKFGAKACAVLDANLSTITPEWVKSLVSPVLDEGFDFVGPCYIRHRYEGAITSGLAYPLTRALYGKRMRHPIGGDFGFSPGLIDYLLERDVWEAEAVRSGVDIWLTTQTLCGGFKLCQAFLGPRVHPQSHQAPDLSSTLAQVLGTLYTEMERNAAVWQRIRGSEPVPTFGLRVPAGAEAVDGNVTPMLSSFRVGHDTLHEIWGGVLSPATMLGLKRLARNSDEGFRFPDELWARIAYDFSLGHRLRTMSRDHLLRAITPLYLGWLASLVLETKEATSTAVEERIEKLCQAYEAQKPYLISRWRWPDRFTP